MAEEFQIITVYFLYYHVKISKTISLKLKKIKKNSKIQFNYNSKQNYNFKHPLGRVELIAIIQEDNLV
jgi:hypothetical protein